MSMQLGMSTASLFGRQYTEDALQTIGEWGIPVCETFLDTYAEYDPRFVRALHTIALQKDVRVASIHAFCTQFEPQLFSPSERQRKDAYGILADVLRAANILGAQYYVFHGIARRGKGGRSFENDPVFAEQLAKVAAFCAAYGVKLALENVCWCTYAAPGLATNLQAQGIDNLYFTLDIKQAILSGAGVDEYLDDMGERLAHVHLCDYRPNPWGSHPRYLACLPGAGELDVAAFLSELARRKFSGHVMLEVYTDSFGDLSELRQCYTDVATLVERLQGD